LSNTHPSSCRTQMLSRQRSRIVIVRDRIEKRFNFSLSQISIETGKGIPQGLRYLAHNGSTHHHSQSIKRRLRTIAIGVGDFLGLHHPIVVIHLHHIANRILGLDRQ